MYALEVKNLSKHFDNFSLKNINFNLEKGYIMGYVGQNGAGKTTTIKLITRQLKTKEGDIKLFGKTYSSDPIGYKDLIGYISDEFYFPFDFKIKDVEDVLADFYPSFNSKKFNEFIKKWNLPQNKKVKDFSKGMKVKLMFAGVLSRDTKLLILDEATSGLDPVIRCDILEILQDYIKDGERSVLFSTHIMDDLEQIADFIFFIDDGKKVFCDSVDNILEDYKMIKGGLDDLSDYLKDNFIGYSRNKLSFKGIIKSKCLENIDTNNILIEKPTINDIVVYNIKGKRGNI